MGFLSGFKTYIAAAGLAVDAVMKYRASHDLTGLIGGLSQALALTGLRDVIGRLLSHAKAAAPPQP